MKEPPLTPGWQAARFALAVPLVAGAAWLVNLGFTQEHWMPLVRWPASLCLFAGLVLLILPTRGRIRAVAAVIGLCLLALFILSAMFMSAFKTSH